jgi:class 3 adenylate cyclase/predicted ATPase
MDPRGGEEASVDVAAWLHGLGLQQYEQAFRENAIDDGVFLELTADDLKDLGVSLVGHRRKLLAAIAALRSESRPEPRAEARGVADTSIAERRHLTVMFCDLVGSTALSTRYDPEDLRAIISTYHRCCTELVERNGGFVAKYMGDGVLTYFGYPQAHEHDAERAVRTALNLVEAVPKIATNAGSPLQVRVGIATGLVVVGDLIGAGSAQEQAVVGETPNLAARLQALAEPGAVVIASSTRRLIGGRFEYRDLGAVALKGFAESMPAFHVLGAGAAESRFEALRATSTPLIGRDEEIEILLRRWGRVKHGEGCVVLISGEPGIGKSRLADTILERLSNEPHARLRYFCSPHHQDSALYPSITQLERAAGFQREDTANQRLDKLEAVLAQGSNDLSEAVPVLADLLSIPTCGRYPTLVLTPQKRKEKTLGAQLAQVEGLASHQPVLMLWEDVHWSDPTTRESLDLLIDRVPTLRVLMIITFRPEFAPPWIARPQVTMLSLNRLSRRLRAEMIAYVASGKALPKEVTDQIVDRTDGVPLFIEELTKTILESGIGTEAGDHYALRESAAPRAIPTTLHASLLARLDRLASARGVAQIGAALGRQFSHELISAVATMPQQQIDDALTRLVNAELIFRRGIPPDAEYTFKHALVQEAAYSTLLRSQRQVIHGRIATTLEDKFSEMATAQPAMLARHCAEAGLIEKAVGYRLKAGQQAIVAGLAMIEAVAQLNQGLDLLNRLPEGSERDQYEISLQVALGAAFIATKGFGAFEVERSYERARELCRQHIDHPEFPAVLCGLSMHYMHRSGTPGNDDVNRELLCVAQQRQDATTRAVAYWRLAVSALHSGNQQLAIAHFEQAIAFSDRAERPRFISFTDIRVSSLNFIALSSLWRGELDEAVAYGRAGLAAAHELGHPYTLSLIFHLNCWLHHHLGDSRTVRERAETALKLTAEHGFSMLEMCAAFWQGWALAAAGDETAGSAQMRDGVATLRALGIVNQRPFFLGLLAGTRTQANDPDEALPLLTEALALIERTQERWFEAELHRLRAEALLAGSPDDLAEAEDCLLRALAVAQAQDTKFWELRAATTLARLWRDQGKRSEARDLLAPIYGWFTEGFDTPVLQDAKALLDELA